tara:strand:- start:1053 stop:1337 length:285 start_codon:yes stop_codon:yes gene_type:complete
MHLSKRKLFVYLRPDFAGEPASFQNNKKIQKCPVQKEHISHQSEREGTNMVLGNAWQLPMAERFLPEEGRREERNYLYPQNRDTKNNDSIFLKY